MKKIIIFTIFFVFISYYCSAKQFHSNYLLVKKYPHELPYMSISIVNDSCAILLQGGDANDTLFFGFLKDKYWLIVTAISDISNIISLSEGDTLVYYKKNIVLFNKTNRLFFQRTIASPNKLSEKTFVYKSKRRKLELKFINDSICTFTNTFYCPNIESEYKVILQNCTYNQNGNEIYLRDMEGKFGNELYIEIPPQDCAVCNFLSKNKREHSFYVGPYYPTEYEKYGKIPNITNDTLIMIDNKIIFHKAYGRGDIEFIFKRKIL